MGGESSSLYANGILPGQSSIFVGTGTTQSAVTFPSATIEAWQKFTATAIPNLSSTNDSNGGSGSSKNSGMRLKGGFGGIVGLLCAALFVWIL